MSIMSPEKIDKNKKYTEDFIKNPAPSKIIFVSQKVSKLATSSETRQSELKPKSRSPSSKKPSDLEIVSKLKYSKQKIFKITKEKNPQ